MEVKPGYKRTDAGVIPDEWEAFQIRDVCRLVNGRGFKPYEWQTAGLAIIRIQNLNGSEDFNFYSGQYNPKILVEHGQLLFAWSGSRGTSFGPHVWKGGRALLNYHTWKVVVNEATVNGNFLLHALRQLTSYIEGKAHGASALVHTQKWEMEKFPIATPKNLPEQRAIAEVLSDVDALLGKLDRLIAKKRDLKQAAMQELLTGQTRLPGFHGEWKVDEFGKRYGEPSRNGISKPAEFQGRGTRIVNMGEMFGFDFISDQEMGRVWLTPKEIAASVLRDGDLLFGRRSIVPAGAGKCTLVVKPSEMLVFESSIIRVRLNPAEADPLFHHYYFASPVGRAVMSIIIAGTNVKGIRASELRELRVPLPPLPEQTAIASVLSDLDAELAALEQRREKTRALKQAMMQELLTGKTRLI